MLHRGLALAISIAGILVAWLAFEPMGLLLVVAAACVWFGWRGGLAAIAATALIWGVLLLSAVPLGTDSLARFVLFIGAGISVLLLVHLFRTVNPSDVLDQESQRLVGDIPGLGWTADPDGRIRFVNPAVLAFLGVSAEEMRHLMRTQSNALEHWTHPEDRGRNQGNWEHSLRTGEPLIDEARVRRYDGVYRWFRDTVVPARDKRGRITGWYGHTVDITDQKRAEEALRNSERELRLIVDTVPAMIFLTNPEGRPYYFNRRFAEWVGTDPGGEATPMVDGVEPYAIYIHPDDLEEVQAATYGAFAAGVPLQHKSRLRRKDGEFRWVNTRTEPLRDETGAITRWYGVIIDIDDEVKAQEALRLADERLSRASRAASLSELSVSIAHELNSPLQAVVANANAYQRWLAADPPNYERAQRTAERIIRDANAAAEVIGRIRSLFAQTTSGRSPVDINALITEVTELVADRLTSTGVRLELALEPGLPLLAADRVQIEQVLLNLVRNGIDAMHDTRPPHRVIRVTSRQMPGEVLEVEVEDRGSGISAPERIFDAFYTTKKDGMGMGLAICRSIIEAHGGRIAARSEVGVGSTVSFTLPLAASEVDAGIGEGLADLHRNADKDVDGAEHQRDAEHRRQV
jgi:PAS domain S-box-containing protein